MVRAPLHFHGRIPVPEVAPLTYRDGVTHLELVYELSEYLKNILHPSLQSTVDQVVADAEQLLSDATAQYVDGVQEFQRIHDAFMSDVKAALVALNDTAASDLLDDVNSLFGSSVRSLIYHNVTINVQHYGAVGDGVHDDTEAIRTAITAADGAPVALMRGATHRITDTIPLDHLDGNEATLAVDANVHGVDIRPHTKASHFTVDITHSGEYTHTGLHVDTDSGWSVTADGVVHDVTLIGKGTDEGVAFGADGTYHRGVLTYMRAYNITARNWEYGLRFIAPNNEHGRSWVTGNNIQMNMYDMKYFVHLEGECDFNVISGQIQPTSVTETVVAVSGNGNDLRDIQLWDTNVYPGIVSYDFTIHGERGSYNKIPSTRGRAVGVRPQNSNPSNTNTLIPWSGIALPKVSNRSQFKTKSGSTQYILENMIGEQDNILKMAHKNYNVSSSHGAVSSAFTFGDSMSTYRVYPGEPLEITIDFEGRPVSAAHLFGVLFGYAVTPDHLLMEAVKTSGFSQTLLDVQPAGNVLQVSSATIAGSVQQLRLVMSVDSTKTLRIGNIFGSSGRTSQGAFIQTNGGTTMWGDIDFGDPRKGPVVRSPNGSRYRLEVSNSGELVVRSL